ncbi:MAG: aminotransferase class I/II-fold pyridoxal phosphate-dependent enzyme [Saprospiraceae bacterium]|nr:aminotransferase class I/II-fold pyridoxal phosphate-dependent enzyme [Saprospiraceae bacterium]MCF8248307.1 aminotransferase class I/II-fold pyridoxal phosphate-dependent enzyme [Saprospiraceae bacterium]MCF8279939.1 aminotransferase class I/II-fold pyridoxal phosphate-dependent enzyme [Bacteroidales bacterium]MCF8309835.1 aminotransferase class I/II-fold pyridoxal phosphate-dependent enzyme [Saprospiraceae bacterium]MCF8438834.1 aminotransferase class I/II-fold pyridoxal phosphate-dependen
MTKINLISDTVTKPTHAMLQAMTIAKVGDDVFNDDPTINALQDKAAQLFGKEAALFCPSGTMTNQIAIKCHTQPLDEVICDHYSHIYQYEVGGYAYNSGVAINLIVGTNGKINADQIKAAIKPNYDWLPRTRLVVLENTANKGGGSYYALDEIRPIRELCHEHGLALHLDGARLFNCLVETEESTLEWGAAFDSISICLSKGLGAPVGSLLIGNQDFIAQSRRVRKVMGGGMRQAGYLAAAGIYALDNHVERLRDDNRRARVLGETLQQQKWVSEVRPVQTNIVIFDLVSPLTAAEYLIKFEENGILAAAFGPATVRFVTHLDFTEEMLGRVVEVLRKIQM